MCRGEFAFGVDMIIVKGYAIFDMCPNVHFGALSFIFLLLSNTVVYSFHRSNCTVVTDNLALTRYK